MHASITWPLVSNIIRGSKLNHTFGMVRKNADGTPRPHQGWDFSAKVGEPAYAICDGTVVLVKTGGDYGLRLAFEFELEGATYYAFYAHLQQVFVAEGATVTRNQLIAKTGNSGNAESLADSEDHLHFEIRTKNPPGLGLKDRVSPLVVFGKCPLNAAIPG